LPQLAALYKKYEAQGFHIIGLECQRSSEDDIKALAKSSSVTFQLTTGGNLKGANVTGIPHGFLFAPDGKLAVDDPRGSALETKVKELIKDVAGMMAGPGPYKKLASLAAQVKAGQGLGAVLKTLETKQNSKDAEEAAEAKMMFEALKGNAQDQLDRAMGKKDGAPVPALAKLDKLAMQFSGNEIATKAKQEADTLRKDPKVKKEIEADGMLKQLEALADKLKPVRGMKDPRDEAFRKANAQMLQSIAGGCQVLNQRYPGTAAAQKAEELAGQYK
jgi:hypothetical protein